MRIRTIIEKEWAEVFKNKLILFTVAFLPLVLLIVALAQLAAPEISSSDSAARMPVHLAQMCRQQGLAGGECLQQFIVGQFMLLFLMVPLTIPVTIAAHSIVGEKVARSLEPLLATPASTVEILLGKGLAAALPAVAATWLSFGVYMIVARFLASGPIYDYVTAPMWLVAMALIVPLLAVFSVNVTIMISSRVNDPRAAQQLGMLVMLPMLGLFLFQALGWGALSLRNMLVMCVALLLTDAAMVVASVRLFQRETILTRWR